MNTEKLVAKAKEFCEEEYCISKRLYNEKKSPLYHDVRMVKIGLQHCLGVVQFIQTCGVKFEDVEWVRRLQRKIF